MAVDSSPHSDTVEYKIVLVEDDEEMNRLLFEELEEAGYHVFPAKNGKDALDLIDAQQPDLVISDLRIPNGGNKFLQKIRQNCKSCRIMVITALRDDLTRYEVEQQGVDAFLGKPIRISELIATIKNLLA